MIWAILSSRLRRWVLLAVLVPLGGRLLEAVGAALGTRNPKAGATLTRAGGKLRSTRRRRR